MRSSVYSVKEENYLEHPSDEDLQSIVDSRFSGLHNVRSASMPPISLPSILKQQSSTEEKISAFYNTRFSTHSGAGLQS